MEPEKAIKVIRKRTVSRSTKAAAGSKAGSALSAVLPKQPLRPYYEAVGRRKSAVARVRLYGSGEGKITVGTKTMAERFPTMELQEIIRAPLKSAGQDGQMDVSIHVNGGGVRGQAEAARLGIGRALLLLNPLLRKPLKKEGFLRRDARVKERKKYGLKRARRAPQWQKR